MKPLMLILIILFSSPTFANFFEDFGASASTLGLAGQANLENPSAASNFYNPASLGFNKNLKVEISSFANFYNIKEISNIVIENSINTESGDEKIGSISNEFSNLYMNAFHVSIPIPQIKSSLNISAALPFPYVAQFDSGDPYTPEYSLLKARPRRPVGNLNLSIGVKQNFAISIGAHLGAKAESEIFTKAAVNNEGETTLYTFASGNGEVAPKFSPIISLFYKWKEINFGFYYQGQLDSNLKINLTADEISTGIIFDSIIESILYYDPATYRVQTSFKFKEKFIAHASLTFQQWKNYSTPKINVTQLAIMTGTHNYETLDLKNTLSPKIAIQYLLRDQLHLSIGLSYKPSPLKGDFSGSGNTIHSDIYGFNISPAFNFKMFNKNFTLCSTLGLEYLKNKKVTKTDDQENGQLGRKIGAPGYEIGGTITTASVGLQLEI